MSLRLEEIPFEFEGKTYMLRCNMAVLEVIQDAHGGNLGEALDPERAISSALEFLTAMINDYAEDQGWTERFTRKQVGRRLSFADLSTTVTKQVMGLVVRSMAVSGNSAPQPESAPVTVFPGAAAEETPDETPPETSGN